MSVSALTRALTSVCLFFSINAVIQCDSEHDKYLLANILNTTQPIH